MNTTTITYMNEVRFAGNVRSNHNARKRVDAYFVSYRCFDAEQGLHEWVAGFEVPRGEPFKPQSTYPSKSAALADRYTRITKDQPCDESPRP